MWKNFSDDYGSVPEPIRERSKPRVKQAYNNQNRQHGKIIASIGRGPSVTINLENLYQIDDEVLGYNLDSRRVLIRAPQNSKDFDAYIALPFTKGATERETGRTLLILGSSQHHIDAMQNQFSEVIWTPSDQAEARKYGNTIRWINVGNTKNGFIGLDYHPSAESTAGVAISPTDVSFLARTLLEAGYEEEKRLFLLRPPYIQEQQAGKTFRKQGLERLIDWVKK